MAYNYVNNALHVFKTVFTAWYLLYLSFTWAPTSARADQDVEQQELSLIAGGNVNVVPSKTKHTLATTRSSNCAPDHQLRH